jgi:hypothetical protein
MKKSKQSVAVRTNDRLPRKVTAPEAGAKAVPVEATARIAYDGPSKTDQAPRPGREGPAKPNAGEATPARAGKPHSEGGDQIPVDRPAGAGGAAGEQYIRLRVRMHGDRLTVLDSHLVDGPLGQAQGFSAAHVYELTLGDRLLHAGELPDLGLQRSFVNPDNPKAGHFITERPITEFTARVAAHEVTPETVHRITLRVHRVKAEARDGQLGAAPLAARFPREIRPVAELVGLPESALPHTIEARGGRTPRV